MTQGNPDQEKDLALPLPITRRTLNLAEQFARQQPTTQKADQVRLNTLAVCAVNDYLELMGISTLLSLGDSWNAVVRLCADVADLEIENVGRLECRPMRVRSTQNSPQNGDRQNGDDRLLTNFSDLTCPIPPEVWEDRIGYVVVQIDESLQAANLLGFVETAAVEELPLRQLHPPEALLDHLDQRLHPISVSQAARSGEARTTTKATVLSQWFQNIFANGWQAIESLLSPEIGLAYGFRGTQEATAQSETTLRRAKIIDLGIQLASYPIVLIVGVMPEPDRRVSVLLQVHPLGDQIYLPPELQFSVLDESNATVIEAQSREADNYIQVQLRGVPGEQFRVRITLNDAIVTEDFVI